MKEHLLEEHENGVATLTLNRPESLNAFSGPMLASLRDALARFAHDDSVRVIVLTGSGRAFSAGGDVKGFVSVASETATIQSDANSAAQSSESDRFNSRVQGLRSGTGLVEEIYAMPKPTVACIPGVAAGGGLSIALSCDIRLAKKSSRFTTAFGKLGLSGDYGGSYFLTRLVGTSKARDLYFTSKIIDATEALRIGLVDHVYDDEEYENSIRDYIQDLAAMPPLALKFMKRNLNAAETDSLSSVLDLEANHMIHAFDTKDHQRGAMAFVTKTRPVFEGD